MRIIHTHLSISDKGWLRLGKKSDQFGLISEEADVDPPSVFGVKILDGAAIVHLLPTAGVSTFDDYASHVFIPYVKKQLDTSTRIDVVCMGYLCHVQY